MRVAILALVLLLAVSSPGQMIPWPQGPTTLPAITFDKGSAGNTDATTNHPTLAYSVTVSAGLTHPVLVVFVFAENNSAVITTTGVTYGAASLTRANVQTVVNTGNGNINEEDSMWYLVNPSSGTATLTVSVSPNADRIGSIAGSFFNVNQSTPVEANNTCVTQTSGLATFSCPVTTVTSGAWAVSGASAYMTSSQNFHPGNGTAVVVGGTGDEFTALQNMSYFGPVSPAAAVTMTWNDNPGFPSLSDWAINNLALKPG